MKINIPSPEEPKKEKRGKLVNFFAGLTIGIIVFGLGGLSLVSSGIGKVKIITWMVLGTGVLSFGFLGMFFGSNFRRGILSLFNW